MYSKRKARLVVFVTAAAILGGGLLAYVSPASTSVNPAPVDRRLASPTDSAIEPWSNYLSDDAVDAGGIENDLDGNASALVASDL